MLVFEVKRLKSQLALAEMTIPDLADKLGFSRQAVHALKDGDGIKVSTLNLYADAIGCDTMDLLDNRPRETESA